MKNGLKTRAETAHALINAMMTHARVYEEWTKTAEQYQICVMNEHVARSMALRDAEAVIEPVLCGSVQFLESWRADIVDEIAEMQKEIKTAGE